jgi:hypothetical protein
MQPLPLTPVAERLLSQLQAASKHARQGGPAFHVAGMGAAFYFAYEQLRNAAEYREHHLLLRSAIGRFLGRYVRLSDYEPAAGELITELTQAGYLKNDSVPLSAVSEIDHLLKNYALMYETLHATRRLDRNDTAGWFYDLASVHIEGLISHDALNPLVMQFAYEHYLEAVDRTAAVGKLRPDDQNYRVAMYCAIQRSLFKSDLATIRYYCVSTSLPDLMHTPIEHFVELNMLITELYQAPLTNQLVRLISRYGAPMRILREVILGGDSPNLLPDRAKTLSRVRTTCAMQYIQVHDKLRGRLGKAILFVFITKTLVGVSIEVPYDLITAGAVAYQPLVSNIVFPMLYLFAISVSITQPSSQNTELIANYVERILYQGSGAPVEYRPRRRVSKRSLNAVFNLIYAAGFLGSLALLLWGLESLGFNIVNGAVFFVFLSAVSFLGFRLRSTSRELVMLDERQSVIQTLADFLTAPFVRIGHWLSDTYARANFVTGLLDIVIEMPLKTTLRMMRQWAGFLRDKQDEL